MPEPSYLERHLGVTREEFAELPADSRSHALADKIPDLHWFFDDGRPFEEREEPDRTCTLARALYNALAAGPSGDSSRSLRERIVTNGFLRSEADRDQNVYLGPLFTRSLTHAVPDLIFMPVSPAETAAAMRWARERKIPVTLRGAASTAMGGAVPNDAGLTLDLSRLDAIDIDPASMVCMVGAGARLRIIHAKLADKGLALKVYPSNLGGTLSGWFVTGGIGMNAYGAGRARDHVRAADVLLPRGEHVRFHDDGRLDVPAEHGRRTLVPRETPAWFRSHGYPAIALNDLAGSEGAFGVVLQLTVRVEKRAQITPFLLAFGSESDAVAAVGWISRLELKTAPANIKLFSRSHLDHVRHAWHDEDARAWHRHPGVLSTDAKLPWTGISSPESVGATTAADSDRTQTYVFVDFFNGDAARAFASQLAECPGKPRVLGAESVRFAAERFRPQQTKRFGPGMLAAEILLPTGEIGAYLPKAAMMARRAGNSLDAEVYVLSDGTSLVIAGFLTDHRSGAFGVDLVLAPALLDLAMDAHHGRPYVLGRWQSAWFEHKFGSASAARFQSIRRALDPEELLNRGVFTGLRLHGVLGALVTVTFVPGIALVRAMLSSGATAWLVRLARGVMAGFPGPAAGRGEPAKPGARFGTSAPDALRDAAPPYANGRSDRSVLLAVAPSGTAGAAAPAAQLPEDRALHCVNCGECNTVCPIFNESKIRLPQMLTHIGEAMKGGAAVSPTGGTLLDLCMRCGNCEQVCQAGIPHLPLYERMQASSDTARPKDVERHSVIVGAVRGSNKYLRDFLAVRPGGYLKRSPASLPGVNRFVVLRSENDAGPAATCIHCGACVAVCPTHANREFEGADPRWITTVQNRCIGCGSCVEVCPNNHANGGQTLRVMEAPTPDWFVALAELDPTLDAEAPR